MARWNEFRLKLPLFMVPRLKYPAGAVLFTVASFMYYYTNHHPLFIPRELPMLSLDRTIPFVPATVLIYVSEYFFFTTVYLVVRDMENLNKYLYSFFFTQAFSCFIFLLWPTIYPRDLYPIPADTNSVVATVFQMLRTGDAATNCFPSLHVSTVYLSAYIFLDEQREKLPFFLTWATFIALSTLPTKQHYVVDITAGFALSVVAYLVFHRWMPYRKVGPAALESDRFDVISS
jgi:membrane-associated phospholipid phosphatase